MTAPAAASRNEVGQRVYIVEGLDMPSSSTCLAYLDRPGINGWKFKAIAKGVAENETLQTLARNGKEWKAAMEAIDAQPKDASEIGTAVHSAVELWLTDNTEGLEHLFRELSACEDEIPDFAAIVSDHLDRFIEAVRDFQIRPLYVEQSLCHIQAHYAGTADGAGWLVDPEHVCDLAHIWDVKTGKAVYPEVALQMSSYARATHLIRFDHETQTNIIVGPNDGICPSVGYAISLHVDRCEIFPVRLTDAFVAFVASRDVTRWKEIEGGAIGKPLKPVTDLMPW